MTETRREVVYGRWRAPEGLGTRGVELIWHIELVDEQVVRRVLIHADTGVILDETWLDNAGRVHSYSSHDRSSLLDAPDG